VSGAHFNPVVSLVEALRNALLWRDAGAYALVQVESLSLMNDRRRMRNTLCRR
jgi:hypothetical protein